MPKDAVALSGLPKKIAEAISKAAQARKEVILLRPVNQLATALLADEYPARLSELKGKDSSWGPQAGMIPIDQRYANVEKANWEKATNDKTLKQVESGLALAMQLRVSEARLKELLEKKAIAKFQKESDGSFTIEAKDPHGGAVSFTGKKAADGEIDITIDEDKERAEVFGFWKAGTPNAKSKLLELAIDKAKKDKPAPAPLLVMASKTDGFPFTAQAKVFAVAALFGTSDLRDYKEDKLPPALAEKYQVLTRVERPKKDPSQVNTIGATVTAMNQEVAKVYKGGSLVAVPVEDKGGESEKEPEYPIIAFEPDGKTIVALGESGQRADGEKELRDYLKDLRERGYYILLGHPWKANKDWSKEAKLAITTQWGPFMPDEGWPAAEGSQADTKKVRDLLRQQDVEPPPPAKGRWGIKAENVGDINKEEFCKFLLDEKNYPSKMRGKTWNQDVGTLWNMIVEALTSKRTGKAALEIIEFCEKMGMKPLDNKEARAFWSGETAMAKAKDTGKALESNDIAKLFDSLNKSVMKDTDWSVSCFLWSAVSQFFGAGAVGNAIVYMEDGFTLNNVFYKTELPMLRDLQETGVVNKILVYIYDKDSKTWASPIEFDSGKLKVVRDKEYWKRRDKPVPDDEKVGHTVKKEPDLLKFRRCIDHLRDRRAEIDFAKISPEKKKELVELKGFDLLKKFLGKHTEATKDPAFATIRREMGGTAEYVFQWDGEDTVIFFPETAAFEAINKDAMLDNFLFERFPNANEMPAAMCIFEDLIIFDGKVQAFLSSPETWKKDTLEPYILKKKPDAKATLPELLKFPDLPKAGKFVETGRENYAAKLDVKLLRKKNEEIEAMFA